MSVQDDVLILAELDADDAAALVGECADEGVDMSEKLSRILRLFLARGDNHRGGGCSSGNFFRPR